MSCLRMVCFGENEMNQLGIKTTTDFQRKNVILSVMHPSHCFLAGSQLIQHDHNSYWSKEEQVKCKVHTINTTSVFDGQTIRKVVCGNYRTFFITDSHKVFCCGLNDFGNLPVSESVVTQVSKPKKCVTKPTKCDLLMEDIVDISCGFFYNIFICRRSLAMYACGNNSYGQCSLSSNFEFEKSTKGPQPVDLSGLKATSKEIVKVSCGISHTLLLTNDKRVYVSGSIEGGKLGFEATDTTIQDIMLDTAIPNFILLNSKKIDSKTVQVEAGSNWSLFLTQDGKVFFSGQSKLFIDAVFTPTEVTTIKPVSSIISGPDHSFFVFRDGTDSNIAGFGRFVEGQLGQKIPPTRDRIEGTSLKDITLPQELTQTLSQISVGGYHTVCTSSNNEVFVTGSNISNQLGFYEDTMRETNLCEPTLTTFNKLDSHYIYQDLNASKNFHAHTSCGGLHTFIYFTSDKINNVIAQFTEGLLPSSSFNDISITCQRKTYLYDEVFSPNSTPLEGPIKKKKI